MPIPKIEDFHLYTHAGCMDGSASAILFRHAGGKKQNVHWVPAGQVDKVLSASDPVRDPSVPVLLVDISPSPDFARTLVARGNTWIIDHHSTALFLNGMHPNFFVDERNEACGCENFRRWLVKNRCPLVVGNGLTQTVPAFAGDEYVRLCRIVDDHDRWQLKIPFSVEVPKFFAFVGQKDFVERFMDVSGRFREEKESYWTPFEEDLMKLLRRIQERRYRATFEKMQVCDRVMLGRSVKAAYVISDEVNNSEMLNLYLKEHPEVDVAVQISFGLQKVSLRSEGRVDVAAVAQQFGGGGHRNAAGHPLPSGMIMEIVGAVHGARS